MTREIDETTTVVWLGLVAARDRTLEAIGAALKAEGLPPLDWYDALWEIEKAGDGGIRPYALKDRLLLPQYGTSRLLARLETAGYVARDACDGDGRGQVVRITGTGRDVRARMWPVYAGVLRARIEDRLNTEDAAALARLLAKLDTG